MSAAEIAALLEGKLQRNGWWRCVCPAHNDDGPSLFLRDGDRALIVNCFAGCTRADILAALRDTSGVAATPKPADVAARRVAQERDAKRRTALAMHIWRTSHPADATTQVPAYLNGRGITIPIPPTLRVHGALGPYGQHPGGDRRPQMVTYVKHADRGGVAVQRTFLAMDGSGKAVLDPVRITIGPTKGAAVRLAPVAATLMIGEGVETCLSAMQATGLGAWSALGASGLAALVLPPEVREVIVLADNDKAGLDAANRAARRWVKEGRSVRLATPAKPGTDFNDLLLSGDAP
jgi:hypothetical protein